MNSVVTFLRCMNDIILMYSTVFSFFFSPFPLGLGMGMFGALDWSSELGVLEIL